MLSSQCQLYASRQMMQIYNQEPVNLYSTTKMNLEMNVETNVVCRYL